MSLGNPDRPFITTRLKLTVNRAKSAVGRPQARTFLGFSFTGGRRLKRRIAPAAVQRLRRRVRTLTRRSRGVSLEQMVEQLASYLRGWRGYFGFCETSSELRDLDSWIRRRLRCVIWKQWKVFRRRRRGLMNRGLDQELASITAVRSHGPWRLSQSKAMHVAFPTALGSVRAVGAPWVCPAADTMSHGRENSPVARFRTRSCQTPNNRLC